jgi:flagellar FliL protein
MAAKSPESTKPAEGGADKKGAAAGAESAPASSSGKGAWLPVIVNLLLMPALGYATFAFLIQPKLGGSKGGAEQHAEAKAEEGKEGEEKGHGKSNSESSGSSHGSKPSSGGKSKITAPLPGKVLVNVAGTQGTRYLLVNMTLVSQNSDLKSMIEKHEAEMKDVAASALANKTIADLEKPGARNVIRSELISVFNNVLGDGTVTEIYLTEFAVQ